MSSGQYQAKVHCPVCGHEYEVTCSWWYVPGSREDPPDGDLEVSPLPENCVNCGDALASQYWSATAADLETPAYARFADQNRLGAPWSVDAFEIMWAEAELQQPEEEPIEGYSADEITDEIVREFGKEFDDADKEERHYLSGESTPFTIFDKDDPGGYKP